MDDRHEAVEPILTPSQMADALRRERARVSELERERDEAREALFNFIADAKRWEEDVDGDLDEHGRELVTITYRGSFSHSSLDDLIAAFGITRGFDETAGDALALAMAASWPSTLVEDEP
jgi:hypothetical protein